MRRQYASTRLVISLTLTVSLWLACDPSDHVEDPSVVATSSQEDEAREEGSGDESNQPQEDPVPDDDRVSVAVSYFDNNTDLPSLEPLKKGMADMMITDLAVSKT